jgi:phage FluMu protein Com
MLQAITIQCAHTNKKLATADNLKLTYPQTKAIKFMHSNKTLKVIKHDSSQYRPKLGTLIKQPPP